MLKKYTLFTLSALLLSNLYIAPANASQPNIALNHVNDSALMQIYTLSFSSLMITTLIWGGYAALKDATENYKFAKDNDIKGQGVLIMSETFGSIALTALAALTACATYQYGKLSLNDLKNYLKSN